MPDREKVVAVLQDIKTYLQQGKSICTSHRGKTIAQERINGLDDALALLKEQEIVRYKDCKHYHKGFNCDLLQKPIMKGDDWFCADGERKEGR